MKLVKRGKRAFSNPTTSKMLIMSLLGYNQFDDFKKKLGITSNRKLYYLLSHLQEAKFIINWPSETDGRIKEYRPNYETFRYYTIFLQFSFGFQYDWFPEQFKGSKKFIDDTIQNLDDKTLNNRFIMERKYTPILKKGQKILSTELKNFWSERVDKTNLKKGWGEKIEKETPIKIKDAITLELEKLSRLPKQEKETIFEQISDFNLFLKMLLFKIYLQKEALFKQASKEEKKELETYFKQLKKRKLDNPRIQLIYAGSSFDKNQIEFLLKATTLNSDDWKHIDEILEKIFKQEFQARGDYTKEILNTLNK